MFSLKQDTYEVMEVLADITVVIMLRYMHIYISYQHVYLKSIQCHMSNIAQ